METRWNEDDLGSACFAWQEKLRNTIARPQELYPSTKRVQFNCYDISRMCCSLKNMSHLLAELTALTHYKYMSITVTINVLYDTVLGEGSFLVD